MILDIIQANFLNFMHHISNHVPFMISAKTELNNFGKEIQDALFPDIPTFLGHIIATIILLIVIVRFGYKPFKESQKEKHEYIAAQIDNANNTNIKARRNQEDAINILIDSRSQSKKIIEDAKEQAKNIKEKNEENIKAEQEKAIIETEHQIFHAKQKANLEMKQKVINLAFDAAEVIVKKSLKNKANEEMINDFLNSVDVESDVHDH